jgi:hypothetical protein
LLDPPQQLAIALGLLLEAGELPFEAPARLAVGTPTVAAIGPKLEVFKRLRTTPTDNSRATNSRFR